MLPSAILAVGIVPDMFEELTEELVTLTSPTATAATDAAIAPLSNATVTVVTDPKTEAVIVP
jgi:hypothetical protein